MEFIPMTFDPADPRPLYQQLYSWLAGEITAGHLAAGEKLPSKRSAAANLGVSLNTVETALGMLIAEGYLTSRPRSGVYVADVSPLIPAPRPAAPLPAAEQDERWSYRFSTSGVDVSLFPQKIWARIAREVNADAPALLNHGPAEGEAALRGAIADYLLGLRGVRCDPDQILVGAGMEYLLGLLAPLLGGRVAFERPGYPKARRILENGGVTLVDLPVDRAGLRVDLLAESGATAIYVTPSHQFPTGATMPVGRRLDLLRWAAADPVRLIVEDDYDSEFRFDGKPVPSLQGLDPHGQVIYVGTFSRSIAPGIRIGYLVLPRALLGRWRQRFAGYSCTVSRLEQQTMARFLAGGHFTRSLNRARGQYRRRRDALVGALRSSFGKDLTLLGAHTGLHLVALPGVGLTERELVERAAAISVELRGLSYYGAPPDGLPGPGVVLGYGTLDEGQIADAIALLVKAWKNQGAEAGKM
ncbi:MAG TPA: PLP-dependent aminotransferase family protein [Candidatus Pygmaiobacter gallistercoris]|nr:PLP-dependent aminotransferase family protein [Candidatus Pygmaiobacter gallistercoris]